MKIGLFGGAFNPPHVEHYEVIKEAKRVLGLDKVVVFPSYLPPHKRTADGTPFSVRVKLCKLAFPDTEVSEIERQDEYVNYAVNTVKKFKEIYPRDKLYYVIGGDSMADLFKWYEPEKLLSMVDLVVYPRDGRIEDMNVSIERAKSLGANITLLNIKSNNISSAEIRYLSSIGCSIKGLVDDTVLEYLKNNPQYSTPSVAFLKARLSERTFNHSLRTAAWAMKLNRRLGLPLKDVFEASLLHDIAKGIDTDYGVPNDALGTPVAHQFSGASLLQASGYSNEVVEAVKYHTTGKEDMTSLQKLVFCADMTEEGRSFDGVEKLRQALLDDFETGFRMCIKRTYDFLLDKGEDIYYLTKDAYLFYKDK